MTKPVIVVGYLGGMGRRYTAILDYLKYPWVGLEWGNRELPVQQYHSLILATPTKDHANHLFDFANLNVPMLCEKPITQSKYEIDVILKNNLKVAMINQYAFMPVGAVGDTYYDYFRTGGDGLEWDCISIIALAEKKPFINNKSPIWKCQINGKQLSIANMDAAYISMIDAWLSKPAPNLDYIKHAHYRVLEGFYEKGSYLHPSPIDQQTATEQSVSHDRQQNDTSESSGHMPTVKRSNRARKPN